VIERLNFYDVYGYLLPGLALLGVGWFPFWFVAGSPFPAALSSALFALVVSYVFGHLLQRLARTAFPQGRAKDGRFPSDYLLDKDDPELRPEVRAHVIDLIQRKFDLSVGAAAQAAEATDRRNEAFLLCRRALIQQKAGSYAEQFEGMYALMRGLAAVAALSVGYHLGWAGGRLLSTSLAIGIGWVLVALGAVSAIASLVRSLRDGPYMFWALTVAFVPSGPC